MASNTDPIILKLELQEAQAKVNIKKLKQELDKLDGRTNEYKLSVKKLQVEEQKLVKIQGDRVTQNKVLSGSLGTLTKGMHGADKATGAATTSVLELGRVVSDAPYGIRGMANNVSQLASNMLFGAQQIDKATGKAVGFTGVIKGMGKAFIGPLGILFAIQAVISAIDFFYGSTKKVEDAIGRINKGLQEMGGETAKTASDLKILKKAIQDGTISTEESNRAIAKANKQYEGLNLKLDENNKLTKDSVDRINEKIQALERLAKANALQSLIETEMSKIGNARRALDLELAEKGLNLKDLEIKQKEYEAAIEESSGLKRRKISKDFLRVNERQGIKLLENFRKLESEGRKSIDSLTNQLNEENLFDELFKDPKGSGSGGRKISPFKIGKELELDIKENDDALLSYSNKIAIQRLKNGQAEELRNAKTEEEKAILKKQHAKQSLELDLAIEKDTLKQRMATEKAVMETKTENFKRDADLRLKAFKDAIEKKRKLGEISDEKAGSLTGEATTETDALKKNADEELKITLEQIEEEYKPIFKLFRKLKKARLAALVGDEEKPYEFDAISHYINTYKTLMSGVTEFINGESERQLTIEQNKTNALNEELNNRLLNENLSKEERASIQNEIWQNDEKLRVKQEKTAKKQFNTAKAFNIIMATVDTYGAANKVLNDPAPIPPFARFALASATIVSGLANVAAIARQKFQSTSAATPPRTGGSGGSGDGVGDREFNFNLVGNTQTNQLAEAIQGQFSQPLKAFVVSKDVTTQQELDANIKGTATF